MVAVVVADVILLGFPGVLNRYGRAGSPVGIIHAVDLFSRLRADKAHVDGQVRAIFSTPKADVIIPKQGC
jgi:hypothetical protein